MLEAETAGFIEEIRQARVHEQNASRYVSTAARIFAIVRA